MPETLTGLFQTLVAASTAAAENLQYKNALVDSIYWDWKPVVATPNTTLNVIIPTVNEADVTDIGSGPLQPTDTDHNSVSIPFNHHFSTSFIIKAWDQARTPQDLERTYLKPRMEAILRAVNRTIAGLINTTNFSATATPVAGYALINGATTGYFLRTDLNQAWENLVNNGTPVDDGLISFVTSPTAYGGMLGDQTMSYGYIVGGEEARDVQQRARLAFIFGAEPKYDQHFGQLSVANGFTAGKQPGAFLHKYAVAAVTAQPAPTDQSVTSVMEQVVWLKNVLPVQIQMGYSLPNQGTIVHIHCYWGATVARADYCSLIQSN